MKATGLWESRNLPMIVRRVALEEEPRGRPEVGGAGRKEGGRRKERDN
jgi:hypothetical protein